MTVSEINAQISAKNDEIAAIEKQAPVTSSTTMTAATSQTPSTAIPKSWWSTADAMTISASVLVFGFVVCLLAAFLLFKGKTADNVLKTLGTILIIVSSLFLVVAGYDDKQIAPVIGLLGTLAGYLLGKGTAPETKPADSDTAQKVA